MFFSAKRWEEVLLHFGLGHFTRVSWNNIGKEERMTGENTSLGFWGVDKGKKNLTILKYPLTDPWDENVYLPTWAIDCWWNISWGMPKPCKSGKIIITNCRHSYWSTFHGIHCKAVGMGRTLKIHQSVGVGNLFLENLQRIKMDLRTTERGRTWSFCSKSMSGYDWMIFGRLGLCSVFLGGPCGSHCSCWNIRHDFKLFFALGETSWLLAISKCFGAG